MAVSTEECGVAISGAALRYPSVSRYHPPYSLALKKQASCNISSRPDRDFTVLVVLRMDGHVGHAANVRGTFSLSQPTKWRYANIPRI
jgi:hypothetical protein